MPYDLETRVWLKNRTSAKNFPAALQLLAGQIFSAGSVLRFAAPLTGFKPSARLFFGPASTGRKGSSDSQGNEKENTMANALGYVSETKTGFEGALAMMNLSASIRIEKNAEKDMDGQPDYRVFAGETATDYAE